VTAGGKAQRVVVPVEVPDSVRAIAHAGVSYSYGFGGLGVSGGVLGSISGSGSGGGGTGWGSIGVGRYGTASAERLRSVRIDTAALDNPLSRDVVADINASRVSGTSGMRGRPRRAATFAIPAPDVEGGGLHKDIVRRYVRRKQAQLTYCYEKELLASPKLGGTVRATFTITDRGTVAGTAISGLGNATVEACIASTLASIEFPRPRGGPVRVTYTFELQPPPSESP
jgi:hypothetical protein